MIEPTETESKETLDEFIAVMRDIAREAAEDPETAKNAQLRLQSESQTTLPPLLILWLLLPNLTDRYRNHCSIPNPTIWKSLI